MKLFIFKDFNFFFADFFFDENEGVSCRPVVFAQAFKESLSAEDVAEIALLLMEETFGDKLFAPIRSRLAALKLSGTLLLEQIDSASTETQFRTFFMAQIHRKCGQFAVDLYRDLKGVSLRESVAALASSEALSGWMVQDLSRRICALMVSEDMDGHALCELEKKELARKLSKYLTLGPALKLMGNLEHHLHAAHCELLQKRCVIMAGHHAACLRSFKVF